LICADHRFQRAQQYSSRASLRLATDIHAVVAPVDCINIGVPCGTKENRVPWRGPPMAVRSRIGWIIVRSQVSLNLHNPPRQNS
jgi:hypothetical protein